MPVIDYVKEYDFEIVTWDVFEKSEELIHQLNLPSKKVAKFKNFPQKQGREYLGLQACLQALDIRADVFYNKNGKPYLNSDKQISISHSYQKVSIAVGRKAIGLDIEKKRDHKVLNIESKFIRPDEGFWIPRNQDLADYLHIIWGIKEGLYKINGGNLWNFLNHYKVESFELIANKPINCWIEDQEKRHKYTAYFRRINEFYLIWVIEK